MTAMINPMDIVKEKVLFWKLENMNSRPLNPASKIEIDAIALTTIDL
ncbi:MAG: hypothetical protein AMDU4_FER2C00006G0026 [Ferroplasma sp. Type II]|nr:MAG: hypothetical protein AMDU4_FER2C00006G0026 [Ferroplasma sp. Type II]